MPTRPSGERMFKPSSLCFIRKLNSTNRSGFPWGGKYKGHEEVRYFFSKLTETIDPMVDPDQFIDDEEGYVVAVGHTRGSVRATRREFEVPAVHVWTIREGRAVKFKAYIDTFQMRVALGVA